MAKLHPAKRYAADVLSGKIKAGNYVKLACQRFLNDIERKDWDFMWSPHHADRAITFMQRMPHTKGRWAASKEKLILQPWQQFIEANLFGFIHKATGRRRFRESYEEVPRKNGKSCRLAARGLYLFCADGESGAEVYSGATSEKQAYEIFRPAWTMAHKLPHLRDHFDIELAGNPKNPGTMFIMKDMSKFETLIGKPGDGASPHGALVDEYHEHDSDQMIDTMRTGMGAREQSMLSIITTAGTDLGSPCFDYRKDIIRLLEGNIEDDRLFGIIYNLDEKDSWEDPANLMKANPNYDISVFGDFLTAQLKLAKRSASAQNAFRTKHLNEWVGAKTAWMNMVSWKKQQRTMSIDDFIGCPCFLAADLSSKKDVTAVNLTFFRDGEYFAFSFFFVPERAVEENERYKDFVLAGCLRVTDGSMIDQGVIEDFILECHKKFKIVDAAFDEWQADYMMVRVMAKGVPAVKYPFTTRNVSEPMKHMEAFVLQGKYWHDGNPMNTWMMGNVSARIDARQNIFPNKDRPNDPKCKIDGPCAAIMSVGRALANRGEEKKYQMIII